MRAENIGREGAAAAGHYVFWAGTTVVDAIFARPSADQKIALAALASQIPQVGGAAGIPPSLPRYLPAAQLDATSVHYAIGPAAWARMGSQLPANAIDFSQDTEVVTAQYGAPGAQNTLTLLLYPTPQIAGAHRKAIDALAKSSGFATKRAGPLVAVVTGNSQSAQQLLSEVHFNDYVTINHPEGYVPEGAKLYRLLVGITMLAVDPYERCAVAGIVPRRRTRTAPHPAGQARLRSFRRGVHLASPGRVSEKMSLFGTGRRGLPAALCCYSSEFKGISWIRGRYLANNLTNLCIGAVLRRLIFANRSSSATCNLSGFCLDTPFSRPYYCAKKVLMACLRWNYSP